MQKLRKCRWRLKTAELFIQEGKNVFDESVSLKCYETFTDHGFLPEYHYSLYNMLLKENAVFYNVKCVSGQKLHMGDMYVINYQKGEIFIFGVILVYLQF